MAEELELIGWQWRFAFPTHKGDWHHVQGLPKTIRNGAQVVGHSECYFEVRDVFAGPVPALGVRVADGNTPDPKDAHGS